MVAVSEYSYNEINIKLNGGNSCDKVCNQIKSLLKTIPPNQNPDDLILNISIQKVVHTVDNNIQKIDISR